jgi:hypothetical protein
MSSAYWIVVPAVLFDEEVEKEPDGRQALLDCRIR